MERKNWFMNFSNQELYAIKVDIKVKTQGDLSCLIDNPSWFEGKKALTPSPSMLAYKSYMDDSNAFEAAQKKNPKIPPPAFRSPYLVDRDSGEFLSELNDEIIFRWLHEPINSKAPEIHTHKKYEYLKVDYDYARMNSFLSKDFIEVCNVLGEEGWLLNHVYEITNNTWQNVYLFIREKREKMEEEESRCCSNCVTCDPFKGPPCCDKCNKCPVCGMKGPADDPYDKSTDNS